MTQNRKFISVIGDFQLVERRLILIARFSIRFQIINQNPFQRYKMANNRSFKSRKTSLFRLNIELCRIIRDIFHKSYFKVKFGRPAELNSESTSSRNYEFLCHFFFILQTRTVTWIAVKI